MRLGALCPPHASELARCDDITAEQVIAAPVDAPAAWLVDQWGHLHGIPASATIGRSPAECAFAVLHHSVSALHAQLDIEGDRARLQDRGSLNGTTVNGERVRTTPLFHGDLLQFGDVRFYFSTSPGPADTASTGGTGRTVPSRSRDLALAVTLAGTGGQLELMQRVAGGIARFGGDSLELARLEFGLLQLLIERKLDRRDPELCFVSSAELSDKLDFKSRDADSDNVRELVRRVRRKLEAAGVDGLIESRQGVGYRIAWDIVGNAASR